GRGSAQPAVSAPVTGPSGSTSDNEGGHDQLHHHQDRRGPHAVPFWLLPPESTQSDRANYEQSRDVVPGRPVGAGPPPDLLGANLRPANHPQIHGNGGVSAPRSMMANRAASEGVGEAFQVSDAGSVG